MEIDDLKAIWKHDNMFQPKGEAEIASMLKGTSKSIVDKLKRNVWLELIFTMIVGIGLLFYAITLHSGALQWTAISILVIFSAYTLYYFKKIFLLNRFDPGKENLKSSIETLVTALTSYLKFYKRSYTILYPTYLCIGLAFAALDRGTDEFIRVISQSFLIIYILGVALIFFFCSTVLTNWYLKNLYGNHLDSLKGILKNFES